MATQIRKFEQDAIVSTINSKIEEASKVDFEQLKETAKFITVSNKSKQILKLADKIKNLEEEKYSLRKEASKSLKELNSGLNRYKVTCGYSFEDEPKLELRNSWSIKSDIANRVAIALLPKDAISNLESIIDKIAKEFV